MALGGWGKPYSPVDVFLNLLLFMPLGFGIGAKLRRGRRSVFGTFAWCVLAGALVSYTVEILQIYVPPRDSGWGDVVSNSFGCGLGGLFFLLCGGPIVSLFQNAEQAVDARLRVRWALLLLAIYFGAWLPAAIALQKQSRLGGWNRQSMLIVGNRRNGAPGSGWKGKISELDIWDYPIPSGAVHDLALKRPLTGIRAPVASYRFSGSPPVQDEYSFLPELILPEGAAITSDAGSMVLDGNDWLTSAGPAQNLVDRLQQTRRFSLRIVCEPAVADGPRTTIFSIAPPSGPADLFIGQDGGFLIFWFRTPLLARRRNLTLDIPAVFVASQPREMVFSYDGGNLAFYVNGNPRMRVYRLSPGAALAQYVRREKVMEVEGYRYIFYAMVFLPAGCLLGLAWRTLRPPRLGRSLALLAIFLVPCFLLEACLMHTSGRPLSKSDIAFSILFLLAGCFWINADRGVFNPRPSEWTEQTS
jgi:VanZ family protein